MKYNYNQRKNNINYKEMLQNKIKENYFLKLNFLNNFIDNGKNKKNKKI